MIDCNGSAGCEVTLNYVIPVIGSILSFFISASPYKGIREAERNGGLGPLNPYPFAVIACNNLVWMMYGLLILNYFMFVPNFLAIVPVLYFTLKSVSLATAPVVNRIIAVFVGFFLFIMAGAMVAFMVMNGLPVSQRSLVVGIQAVLIQCVLYMSPLSTLVRVIRERNSVYFYFPLTLTCLLNAILWTIYGLVISDFFVAGPNAAGVVLSAVQLICVMVFPKRVIKAPPRSDSSVVTLTGVPVAELAPEEVLITDAPIADSSSESISPLTACGSPDVKGDDSSLKE